MRFGVLGPVAVGRGGGALEALRSPSQRRILAVLLAHRGRTVSAESLMDAIWGEALPASAAASLRSYISRLRREVGDRITHVGDGYRLRPAGDDTVDADAFETALAAAASGSAEPDELAAALALWRGPAFADVADLELVAPEARRLDELRLGAADAHGWALLRAGRAPAAVAVAETQVAAHPLREGSWALLVRALATDARPGEALRAYQRAAVSLAEAGLEPSATLRDAERSVIASGEPEVAFRRSHPAALRADTTSLVGRDKDLERVHQLLEEAQVVTIHGPGGVGKTRLAREIARARFDRHERGVLFVPLARLVGGHDTVRAIADSLGLTPGGRPVIDALSDVGPLDVLVILDNCEHVLDAAAAAIEAIVAGGGAARILTTSRERIGLPGEMTWPLEPLGDDGAAVELFVDRARAVRPDLHVGPAEMEEIRRVVRRVDGLPLAIEMAAARVSGMSVIELSALLDERIDVLRTPGRTADERHHTMAAVIDWSDALLDEAERRLFRDMSVFAGAAPAAHIGAVTGIEQPVELLADLVDRSLVVADTTGPATTYRLLGLVRRHCRATCDEAGRSAALARRHLDFHIALAGEGDAGLRTREEAVAHRTLDGAFAELRAAHALARSESPEAAAALSAALHLFGISRCRPEVQDWAAALGPDLAPGPDGAAAMASVAFGANNQGDFVRARLAAERAIELARGDAAARFAHEVLSDAAIYHGDLGAARRHAQLLTDLSERAGDLHGVAMGRSGVALALAYEGRYEDALDAVGDPSPDMSPSDHGWLHYSQGEILLDVDPERALAALVSAIAAADSVGERFLAGVARVSWVSLLSRHGDPAQAVASFGDVIRHWQDRGHQTHLLTTLRNLVVLFDRVEAREPAARLLGSIEAASGAPTFGVEAERLSAARERATHALGSRFELVHGAGARTSISLAAARALDDLAAL